MTTEQRHFTRIPFNASTTLVDSKAGTKYTAELIDISFKGVLVKEPTDWQGKDGDQYTVHFQLAGDEIEINLNVIVVHSEEKHIGFKTENMDLDTATNLRRLVELNLGDESLLERELAELIHAT